MMSFEQNNVFNIYRLKEKVVDRNPDQKKTQRKDIVYYIFVSIYILGVLLS